MLSVNAYSQNIGINDTGSQPNNSAMLDVQSPNKGILIPRMTQTERNAITSPATGLMVFQTDGIKGYYFYETTWKLVGGNSPWTASGSDITYNTGKVGIGTSSVNNKLEIRASENEGITIGNLYDAMGFNGGSYNLKFYGFSENYTSSIAAKITADRTDRWGGEWKRQGTSLGFYTTSSITGSYGDFSIERMRITDDGMVGIGKSLPSTLLDVNGVITATGGNSADWNTAYGWGSHAGSYRPISWVPAWTDVTSNPIATVATSGSYNDLSDKPTILNSQWASSGSDLYYSTGNVGIGTSSFTDKLEVAASENEGITIGKPNDDMGRDGGSYGIKFYGFRDIVPNVISAKITADRTDAGSGWLSQGTSLGFYTVKELGFANADNSLERMRITDTGSVGIGTSAPSTLLDVNGVLTATGGNSGNWNTAFSWGNHAGLYKPLSYVPGWSSITDKPTFATVATSGSYSDLSTKAANATTSSNGFVSSIDKIKLNGLQNADGSETKITTGTNVTSTGTGTAINPFQFSAIASMSQTQRSNLTPVGGQIIYNTSTNKPNYYNGTQWMAFDGTSATTPVELGEFYQGGIVVHFLEYYNRGYVAGETHGLIVSPFDISGGIVWGPQVPTGATGFDVGDGPTNTGKIVATFGPGDYAASLCDALTLNGYSDWYLPSTYELTTLYHNNIPVVLEVAGAIYWSSSEQNSGMAKKVYFRYYPESVNNTYPEPMSDNKNTSARVRAFRAF